MESLVQVSRPSSPYPVSPCPQLAADNLMDNKFMGLLQSQTHPATAKNILLMDQVS